MRAAPPSQLTGMHRAALSLIGFKDLANLVIGFALLVLLVLLVKELSSSRGR